MIATDSIAIGTPKAAPSLALLWEEKGGSVEIIFSDGRVEIAGVVAAEEPTGADGSAELEDLSGGMAAEVVVLPENVPISTCQSHVSNNVSENDISTTYCSWQKTAQLVFHMPLLTPLAREKLSRIRRLVKPPK